jgi:hypothetical protein
MIKSKASCRDKNTAKTSIEEKRIGKTSCKVKTMTCRRFAERRKHLVTPERT